MRESKPKATWACGLQLKPTFGSLHLFLELLFYQRGALIKKKQHILNAIEERHVTLITSKYSELYKNYLCLKLSYKYDKENRLKRWIS